MIGLRTHDESTAGGVPVVPLLMAEIQLSRL